MSQDVKVSPSGSTLFCFAGILSGPVRMGNSDVLTDTIAKQENIHPWANVQFAADWSDLNNPSLLATQWGLYIWMGYIFSCSAIV